MSNQHSKNVCRMSYKAIVQLSGMIVTTVFTTGFVMIVNRDGIRPAPAYGHMSIWAYGYLVKRTTE